LAPHGLAVDSRGDIYVGEVSWTAWPQSLAACRLATLVFRSALRPEHAER
jgi:hypothetical protein